MPHELPLAGAARERRDAALNRRRILEASRRLVVRDGPDALSMVAVADEAGVGKGTIFRRFGDRAGLVRALIDEYMRDFQDAFLSGPPPLGPGAPPDERLEAFLVALVRLQRDNLAVAITGEPRSERALAAAYGPLHTHTRSLVESLGGAGDPTVVATMLLSAISPTSLDVMLHVHGASVDAVTAAVRTLLEGIVRADVVDVTGRR